VRACDVTAALVLAQASPPFIEGATAFAETLDALRTTKVADFGLFQYSVLLQLCVATKNLKRAVQLHRHMMQREDLDHADMAGHFALLIHCCFACNQVDSAFQVWPCDRHCRRRKAPLSHSPGMTSRELSTCCWQVWHSMPGINVEPGSAVFVNLVGGCCDAGRFDRVDEVMPVAAARVSTRSGE
jgi:hypothetical protein